MPGTDQLFRQQAVDAQNVMHGRVRIAPPPGWMITNILLIGLVALAILFASLATYARTVSVDGVIDTSSGTPALKSQDPGIVLTHVELGDRVKQGDLIAETVLQNTDERGDTALRRQKAIEGEKEVARLRAESATEAGRSQAEAARIRAASARSRIATLQDQLTQARTRTQAARSDLERARSIAERGFLSKRDLEGKESEVAARRQEEAEIEERIASARGESAAADAEAAQALSRAEVDRAEALEAVSRAERSETDDSVSMRRTHIASTDGFVAAMPVKNGQSITSGQTIAVIMPKNAQIVATLRIPASAMSEIRKGQHVGIAVDSYPYQTFGMIQGKVETVARIATEGEDGSTYQVQVSIPDHVIAYGKKEPLLPGMSLSARITTQKRTLIEWLLDPLYAVTKR